ncbi:hypothetical protein [Mycobacterium paragordonae]|uniref:Uncharacterized protein n=1 Tax=Mycobacterium paragordonae TaxID=1389713 RepID=A0A4R5WYU9_9MYCO|nr:MULTISPECIES: hypothetical protein [Mycobacterium]MDP7735775.1 hypothetical protein [Mycobacterium paragordonae]TDL01318.1 hypothetical protein EUA02_03585 [Mycobacterium paragordonae]TDL10838.1 hypothetical protein EUA05_05875 [Mycobacterium paragordonae]
MTQQPVPPRAVWRRSSADVVFTVVLFVAQFVASALAFVGALGPAMWLMLPGCSDNCDNAAVDHFYGGVTTGVAVVAGGIVAGLLLAVIGSVIAGIRRSVMCVWPGLGLTVVGLTFLVALWLWLDAVPAGKSA